MKKNRGLVDRLNYLQYLLTCSSQTYNEDMPITKHKLTTTPVSQNLIQQERQNIPEDNPLRIKLSFHSSDSETEAVLAHVNKAKALKQSNTPKKINAPRKLASAPKDTVKTQKQKTSNASNFASSNGPNTKSNIKASRRCKKVKNNSNTKKLSSNQISSKG